MKVDNLKICFLVLLITTLSLSLFARSNNMHHQLTEAQRKIKALCVDRYRSPGDFVEFTNKLMSLGVIRQTYDVLQDDLMFYSKEQMLYHLPASEIDPSIDKNSFEFGDSFDLGKVKKAIEKLDMKKITAAEFHHEVAQAGIVYVSVYLKQRKIYYMSQDGQYFLESY